jgi:hypothetical protein
MFIVILPDGNSFNDSSNQPLFKCYLLVYWTWQHVSRCRLLLQTLYSIAYIGLHHSTPKNQEDKEIPPIQHAAPSSQVLGARSANSC